MLVCSRQTQASVISTSLSSLGKGEAVCDLAAARSLVMFSIFCSRSSSRYGLMTTSSIPAALASSIWPCLAFPAGQSQLVARMRYHILRTEGNDEV